MVVIVDHDQVPKLQVTCGRRCLAGDALHGAAIAKKAVGVVVDNFEARPVEDRACMGLCNGKTNSIAEALPEGTRGDLDTIGVMRFRMTGRDAVDLLSKSLSAIRPRCRTDVLYPEIFEVIHCHLVSEKVEQSVLQHAAMAVAIEKSASRD